MENFGSHAVWEGTVSIFELKGHPKATKCYAWSSPIVGHYPAESTRAFSMPPTTSSQRKDIG